MTGSSGTQNNNLEDLLVREFRACQQLLNLTKDERQALVENDTGRLAALLELKECWLDELTQIEDQRRRISEEIARAGGANLRSLSQLPPLPFMTDLVAALDPEAAQRVSRMRAAIAGLSAEIRELSSGNRALAISALERNDAFQKFLLDLLYAKPVLWN